MLTSITGTVLLKSLFHLTVSVQHFHFFIFIFFSFFSFLKKLKYIYFLLYNIVLVLPHINMNPLWAYACSPS